MPHEEYELGAKENNKKKYIFGLGALVAFGAFLFIILVFNIANIAVNSETLKKVKHQNSNLPLTERSEFVEYLLEKSQFEECANGFTSNPISICISACAKEFCKGDFSVPEREVCLERKCASMGTSYEQCINGCLCCQATINCLLDNENDRSKCDEILHDCNHAEIISQEHNPSDVCYVETTLGCQRSHFFNFPIKC